MPEYYVSVEYRLKIEAANEGAAAIAAKILEPRERPFATVTILGTDIITIAEENTNAK